MLLVSVFTSCIGVDGGVNTTGSKKIRVNTAGNDDAINEIDIAGNGGVDTTGNKVDIDENEVDTAGNEVGNARVDTT